MSAPSSYIVRFTEWIAMEIIIDEAQGEHDALAQAKALWEQSSDVAKIRDNGSENWEAEVLP
jgi:hypothetical protein